MHSGTYISMQFSSNLAISPCRMESVYRTWMRERSNGSTSEEVDDLQRELQTALGTAKWQACFFT